MTDPRRLLARLNPTNIRYDVGRGGIPELTSQDIAAALAFVPAGLGREVFCALWWPDGSRLSPFALYEGIAALTRAEMERRHRAAQIARLSLHIAEEDVAARRVMTDAARRELDRLRAVVADAKAKLWPYDPQMHVAIRRAVIDELALPHLCPGCGGAGEVMDGELRTACQDCEGRGTQPPSNSARAARIGRDESSYRKTWRDLYEWLYRELADAESCARKAFKAALRDPDRIAA